MPPNSSCTTLSHWLLKGKSNSNPIRTTLIFRNNVYRCASEKESTCSHAAGAFFFFVVQKGRAVLRLSASEKLFRKIFPPQLRHAAVNVVAQETAVSRQGAGHVLDNLVDFFNFVFEERFRFIADHEFLEI
jgi:hypothetical protein